MSKKEKIPREFAEVYKALPDPPRQITPKLEFVKRMAEITKSSENAVRMWINGRQRPDALKQAIIAEELGIPSAELFPN
jgi:transcriptional regulator with XRE-family HTH domain